MSANAPLPGDTLVVLGPGLDPDIARACDAPLGAERVFVPLDGNCSEDVLAAWCRAADEVWLRADRLPNDTVSPRLEAFRLHSIPPELGESHSLLHAPELGMLRHWQLSSAGRWECVRQVDSARQLVSHREHEERTRFLHAVRRCVGDAPDSPVEAWRTLAQGCRREAGRIEAAIGRWLALAFVVTVLSGMGLQAVSMLGLNLPMAVVYALFFMLVGTLYAWVKGARANARQLGYRLLADAMEIQAVWRQAGLKAVVAGQFLIWHGQRLQWVRNLLRPLSRPLEVPRLRTPREVLLQWVPQLLTQHREARAHQERRHRMFQRAVWMCYGLSAALTLATVLGYLAGGQWAWWWGAGLGVSSTLGTLLLIFRGTLAYSENAAIHAHVVHVLERARTLLEEELPVHEYDELLLDVGRECLQAAADRAMG